MATSEFRLLKSAMAGVEAVAADTRRSFPRHTHEQFGIGVIDRGAHRSLSGRGVVEAEAGDTITVNPGEVHDGMPVGDAARSWRMLYLSPSLIFHALGDIEEGRAGGREFHHPVMRSQVIAGGVRQLIDLVATETDDLAALRQEEVLLALLAGAMSEARAPESLHAPSTISRARELIDDDPTSTISLADLALESGLSRFQVLRGFARATGLTPHAYIIQRRIQLAKRLIADRMPLAEVAIASGFADQSHMTRIFVRNFGLPPGAYAAVEILDASRLARPDVQENRRHARIGDHRFGESQLP
ncbi:AraC family transcriptional regulator [Rhizobium sp. BK251]|uniref:helix-turn-helix transcriptional regulator n=1 Tax=Rhizobium sp. BK251 TaxID=2512125 RepID=UPI001051CC7B|nr:AraC family transcriptional regulator [Rhizobium sp. BK251]TCL76042.1 AraC-like DNA-binding protein [Rhizobium sp. BK251]